MLQRPWIVETDPDKADFIIATELWPCGRDQPVELIDEVKRFDRTFAWIYARSQRASPASQGCGKPGLAGPDIRCLPDCASVIAIFRASVVISSVWVRSFRCRLSRTMRLMQTQT